MVSLDNVNLSVVNLEMFPMFSRFPFTNPSDIGFILKYNFEKGFTFQQDFHHP